MLKVRPHTKRKSGGGGGGGGGSPLQVRYTKSEGGQFASGPIRKVGGGGRGGASPLQVQYTKSVCVGGAGPIPLFGTQKISTCIPTYVLPRYTSHARARMNVKYMPAKVNLL